MATVNISDMAKTWNDAGTTFTAIKMDVTNTASNAASLLMDLQVGGTTVFSVGARGDIRTNWITDYGVVGGEIFFGGSSNDGTNALVSIGDPGLINIRGGGYYGWASGNSATAALNDTRIYRDAANVVALRNTTTAQTYRVYGTFTDSSNYERLAVTRDAITVESAGTGTANIDLALTPAGTGVLKFGTHTAVGSETLSGYITIKDAGGTSRKVAVVS